MSGPSRSARSPAGSGSGMSARSFASYAARRSSAESTGRVYARALSPLREQRDVGGQHLDVLLGDQHVVLDADPAEVEQALGALPVDRVAVARAELRVVEQCRH